MFCSYLVFFFFFFFNDTATTEIYPLSLHDALPILRERLPGVVLRLVDRVADVQAAREIRGERGCERAARAVIAAGKRSEEHTSELQSPDHLVCRLLLEKKKQQMPY